MEPVEIPRESLSPDALRGLIEEFVTRDGTDYGSVERTLEEKVAAVERQLASGEVRIFFEPESESVTLLPVEASR